MALGRSPSRSSGPGSAAADMANGDKLLDASGNVILDASGNIMLSDAAGDACCCGPQYVQAQMCATGELIDLWFVLNEDGTIETIFGDKPLPFYFFENQCNYVPRNPTTSGTPGDIADDIVELDNCCCEDDDVVWVFVWTASYNCNTEEWTGPTQDTRSCEDVTTFTEGWKKVSVDATNCYYTFTEAGFCCVDPEDPPDWPPTPTVTSIQDTCDCPDPCDNYCLAGGNTDCGTERAYYDCPIFAHWVLYAAEGCAGKEGSGLLDGGGCLGGSCAWNQVAVDPDAADVLVQFTCDTSSNCPLAGANLKAEVVVEYPGLSCDGRTADFACSDNRVPIGAMHGIHTFPLYRTGTSGTTEIGTVTFYLVC
jgi:hypothetical protein